MQWELGFFDGFKEKVAILPISKEDIQVNAYSGVEYLGLYPYVFYEKNVSDLKIKFKDDRIMTLNDWLNQRDVQGELVKDLLRRLR